VVVQTSFDKGMKDGKRRADNIEPRDPVLFLVVVLTKKVGRRRSRSRKLFAYLNFGRHDAVPMCLNPVA
jgi:hypothetical protein